MLKQATLPIALSLCLLSLLQGCIVAAGAGAATGTAMVWDRRTTGSIMDDQSIHVKAVTAISHHKALFKESHINLISYNNVVLLVGQTPTDDYKRQIEEIVSKVPRVRHVHNELSVSEPSSLITRSKDAWITTQIKTKLFGDKEASAGRVKVITEDGIVYLMGLTTPEEALIATDIARAASGVEKVVQIFETVSE